MIIVAVVSFLTQLACLYSYMVQSLRFKSDIFYQMGLMIHVSFLAGLKVEEVQISLTFRTF